MAYWLINQDFSAPLSHVDYKLTETINLFAALSLMFTLLWQTAAAYHQSGGVWYFWLSAVGLWAFIIHWLLNLFMSGLIQQIAPSLYDVLFSYRHIYWMVPAALLGFLSLIIQAALWLDRSEIFFLNVLAFLIWPLGLWIVQPKINAKIRTMNKLGMEDHFINEP